MKYADILPGPVVDLTHLAEEQISDPQADAEPDFLAADQQRFLTTIPQGEL
jgi:hypothetical protein